MTQKVKSVTRNANGYTVITYWDGSQQTLYETKDLNYVIGEVEALRDEFDDLREDIPQDYTDLISDVNELKNDLNANTDALLNGSYIPLIKELSLTEGTFWAGSVGGTISTDSYANATVRNNSLYNFGDKDGVIGITNSMRVKVLAVEGTTIISDSGWLTSNTDYTFYAEYDYAFNFMKVDSSAITKETVLSSCSINVYSKINETSDKLDGFINHINEVIPPATNLFNRNDAIIGKFYAGGNTTPTTADNTRYCCYLAEIHDDSAMYIMNYKDYTVDAFDENKQRISEVYFSANVAHSVPSGTKYLSISLLVAHLSDYMLIQGTEIPSDYVQFGTTVNGLVINREYHIGINDTSVGKYFPDGESVTALFKKLADDYSPKTIYIHEGTYDIFAEYGGATFIASLDGTETWRDVSVFVPPNTKVIGIGTVTLKFKPTSAQIVNDYNARLFSILNIDKECYVENLILDGMNCRYCIHDETSGVENRGVHHIFKNVICIKTQDTYGDGQCFGAGFQEPLIYDFENCRMSSWSIPFSIHNGTTSRRAEGSLINIKNCCFEASVSSVSMSFRNNTEVQQRNIVNINNSSVGGQWANIEVTASGNTTYPNSFDIQMLQCNAVRGQEVVTPTNLYPIVQIMPIGTV